MGALQFGSQVSDVQQFTLGHECTIHAVWLCATDTGLLYIWIWVWPTGWEKAHYTIWCLNTFLFCIQNLQQFCSACVHVVPSWWLSVTVSQFLFLHLILPIFGIYVLLWLHMSKTSCAEIMHFTHDPVCVKNGLKWSTKPEIKIKQTSRGVKFETARRSVHIVYHPTPGHFLPHQKACCKRRFRHMSHHFLLFFPEWNKCWWKAAILLFTLQRVLLSRLLLNSAMAESSIHICFFLLFFFLSPSHPLCFLPLLVIFPQRQCVSFLFDVWRMNKAICNIYMH